MESVGPVVPTNEVETKFVSIEVTKWSLWAQWVPTNEVEIKFESIEATNESVGPVVPTNEFETKFETIEVTNGVCGPSGPNK